MRLLSKKGSSSVDAHTFYQVVRSLTEPTIHLKSGEANRLTVSCGSARFNVVGMAAEDFPPLPTRDERSSLNVSSEGLRRVIDETIFSISSDDNRYGLNGAHMEEITAKVAIPECDWSPRMAVDCPTRKLSTAAILEWVAVCYAQEGAQRT